MSTLIASRSAHLVQPGLAESEFDESLNGQPRPTAAGSSVPESHDSEQSVQGDDLRAREVAWACEWWPPD